MALIPRTFFYQLAFEAGLFHGRLDSLKHTPELLDELEKRHYSRAELDDLITSIKEFARVFYQD